MRSVFFQESTNCSSRAKHLGCSSSRIPSTRKLSGRHQSLFPLPRGRSSGTAFAAVMMKTTHYCSESPNSMPERDLPERWLKTAVPQLLPATEYSSLGRERSPKGPCSTREVSIPTCHKSTHLENLQRQMLTLGKCQPKLFFDMILGLQSLRASRSLPVKRFPHLKNPACGTNELSWLRLLNFKVPLLPHTPN